MAALTTNLDLDSFTITKTEETPQVILAYGNTTETAVDCRVCGHQTSYFHGVGEQRQVQHLWLYDTYRGRVDAIIIV